MFADAKILQQFLHFAVTYTNHKQHWETNYLGWKTFESFKGTDKKYDLIAQDREDPKSLEPTFQHVEKGEILYFGFIRELSRIEQFH